jgi:hypothetical protein
LHVFKALFGRFVSRIEVGMIFPRELAIGLPNLLERRILGHTQCAVIILVGRHMNIG